MLKRTQRRHPEFELGTLIPRSALITATHTLGDRGGQVEDAIRLRYVNLLSEEDYAFTCLDPQPPASVAHNNLCHQANHLTDRKISQN